ncbi:STAS domain-containing protein [Streptomyces hokutonensis]|uniref:STAS domain-containing protein n=1 Tax=Streptomyces hokutonensis TaxID=1306990 RepID=UPI001FE1BEAA|nr:STAS domain-containing protein [Streptomyces hokutonensis]
MPDSSPARGPHEHHRLPGMVSRIRHPFRRSAGSTSPDADHVVVRLSGEITSKNAQDIGVSLREFLRAPPRVLEVDFDRVTYLSADGGGAFFMALLAARPHGTQVIVTHASAQARTTLTQLGLLRALDIYDGDGPDHA